MPFETPSFAPFLKAESPLSSRSPMPGSLAMNPTMMREWVEVRPTAVMSVADCRMDEPCACAYVGRKLKTTDSPSSQMDVAAFTGAQTHWRVWIWSNWQHFPAEANAV